MKIVFAISIGFAIQFIVFTILTTLGAGDYTTGVLCGTLGVGSAIIALGEYENKQRKE